MSYFNSVHVPGNHAAVFGQPWSFTTANQMTLIADYIWRWTADCPSAMQVEYKFAMNGTWDINRGLGSSSGVVLPQFNPDLVPFGANIPISLPAGIAVWEYYEDTDTSRVYRIDFNSDHVVNLIDVALMTQHWLESECWMSDWCDHYDTNQSGRIDGDDLRPIIDHWLMSGHAD